MRHRYGAEPSQNLLLQSIWFVVVVVILCFNGIEHVCVFKQQSTYQLGGEILKTNPNSFIHTHTQKKK